MTPAKRIQIVHEYLELACVDGLIPADPSEDVVAEEIKKPLKYNRVPFETKNAMIAYYMNNHVTCAQVAEKFGINKNTAAGIISRHKNAHPELYVNK